jgi:hypothetical protein
MASLLLLDIVVLSGVVLLRVVEHSALQWERARGSITGTLVAD